MEDMISFMYKFKTKITPDDSLTGFLKNKSSMQGKPSASPINYYFLTDLCSPMDTYIKINFPNIEVPLESKKKMNTGNKIHQFAVNWFQKMEGFESSESLLDGIYFGLPVRGRIDARVNGSIIELKTKEIIPQNKEEIINMYPQDVEQLGFYVSIDPTKPKINYLVFLSHEVLAKLRVFKVEINDLNRIKYVLKKRIDDLDKALKEKDPFSLGRCRYCGEVCRLKSIEGNCQWFNTDKRECEISQYIEISEDKNFEDKIRKAMESWDGHQDTLSPGNILIPRKHLCKQVLGEKDDFSKEAEDVWNMDHIKKLASELRKSFLPVDSEIPENNFKEISFSKYGWIRRKSSAEKEEKNLPFIVYSSMDDRKKGLTEPGKYKIAELGIIASSFNLSKGIIIVYYPKLGEDKYKVFEVDYTFTNQCKNKVKEIVDILKKEDISKLKQLPPCPWFVHKDGKPNVCCS